VPELADTLAAIALPALFAGLVAILATVAVERLGGVSGGVLSSIPTTIVPAAIGIFQRSADTDSFRRAMAFVPVGILMNAGYLLLWRVIPAQLGTHERLRPRLLTWTVLLAIAIWLVAATSVVAINAWLEPSVPQSIVTGCIAFAAGIALGIAANRVPHPAPKGTHRVSARVLLMRGVAAAAAIAVSIVLARSGHPVASGIASVFPAIFTTIMIATWLAQGAHVPTGAVGPMALGTLSVSAYALLATALFPLMPVPLAAVLCWLLAIAAVSLPAYAYLGWRRRQRSGA
jgi:hypothetical protein